MHLCGDMRMGGAGLGWEGSTGAEAAAPPIDEVSCPCRGCRSPAQPRGDVSDGRQPTGPGHRPRRHFLAGRSFAFGMRHINWGCRKVALRPAARRTGAWHRRLQPADPVLGELQARQALEPPVRPGVENLDVGHLPGPGATVLGC
jgi:hypothetical protein